MAEELITTRKLTRRFGEKVAVQDLDLSVNRGEIVGFLGPNGAGKTTTLRMLTCFLPPTSGTATVAGFDCFTQAMEVRAKVGYMPEAVPLYPDMRVKEYLVFRARLKGIGSKKIRARVDDVVQQCGLSDVYSRIIGQLSRGYRQRLGLADALIHDPDILILDEPTVGLDPNQVRETREMIRDLGRDRTVLLSTHILPEVELLCTKVIIIHEGKLVAQGDIPELKARLAGPGTLKVLIKADSAEEVQGALSMLDTEAEVEQADGGGDGHAFILRASTGKDMREDVFNLCVHKGWVLLGLERVEGGLEDVFARLTTSEEAQA